MSGGVEGVGGEAQVKSADGWAGLCLASGSGWGMDGSDEDRGGFTRCEKMDQTAMPVMVASKTRVPLQTPWHLPTARRRGSSSIWEMR
jgi:hypothetical protein